MDLRDAVEAFYAEIWNRGDLAAVPSLLRDDFTFRGSLGAERKGHAGFVAYVELVRGALADYRCEILDLVVEPPRAFARMRFSGVHRGAFLGFAPTGRRLEWMGAALFTAAGDGRIAGLWVLGDLQALTGQLEANARAARGGGAAGA
jgi:predicted ester cyclase